MATLKHVENSMGSDVAAPQQEMEMYTPDELLVPITSVVQPYVIFKLVNRNKKLYIDGICHDVLNPKTNEYDNIWLVRGVNSIWEKDLREIVKDMDKPNSRINRNRISLEFEDGICRIPSTEKNHLEFARRHKSNVGKNRAASGRYSFYEYDPAEEQRMRLEKQMTKIKLIQSISTMDSEQMKKLAFWFDIKPNDDLGLPKGVDGIRDELLVIADSRPADVQKFIGSKEVEISYMVRKAIIEAKIDLTANNGSAMWAHGKGFIAKIPAVRKAHEYLTELAMTNSDDGRRFKEQLEKVIT